jgi:ribonuclease HI/exonuclease III
VGLQWSGGADARSPADVIEANRVLLAAAASIGATVESVPGDGNCQYRAVAAAYKAAPAWRMLKTQTLSHVRSAVWSTEFFAGAGLDLEATVDALAREDAYGDHITLLALARYLRIALWVLRADHPDRFQRIDDARGDAVVPSRVVAVSFRGGDSGHYDCVRLPRPVREALHEERSGHWVLQRPGDYIRVATYNVASLPAGHHAAAIRLAADVVAMQEVRTPASEVGRMNQAFRHAERDVKWGRLVEYSMGPAGKWVLGYGGVAFSTPRGMRPRLVEVQSDLHKSGRGAHLVVPLGRGGLALHVLNIYAQVGRSDTQVDERESIISTAVEDVLALGEVPAVICGDFNSDVEGSPALTSAVTMHGFVDAEQRQAAVEGRDRRPTHFSTFAGGTHIDKVMLNPLAARMLHSVEIPASGEAGHRPVVVSLSATVLRLDVAVPQLPKAFPVPDRLPESVQRDALAAADGWSRQARADLGDGGGAQELLSLASAAAEQFLAKATITTDWGKSKYLGRGAVQIVTKQLCAPQGPPDLGAAGRLTVDRHVVVRRLTALIRTPADSTSQTRRAGQRVWTTVRLLAPHVLRVWSSSAVWRGSAIPPQDTLVVLRRQLRDVIRADVKRVKLERRREARETTRETFKRRPGRIFRALTPKASLPLQMVRIPSSGRYTADPHQIDELLRSPLGWGGVMCRHSLMPATEPDWAAFRSKYGRFFPPRVDLPISDITGESLKRTISRMPARGVPGMDGWRPRELKLLPTELLDGFAAAYNTMEHTGECPDSLLDALVAMIPKSLDGTEVPDPMQLRPITITSVLYRVWAATRLRDLMPWQEQWLPATLFGFRQKHGTQDLYWHVAFQIERANITNTPIYGVQFDFQKCFDSIPHKIMFGLAEALGIPERLLRPLRTLYGQLRRRFRVAGHVGEPFIPSNGILQGCALAVVLLNIIMTVWCRVIKANVAAATPAGYADDVGIQTSTRPELRAAIQLTAAYADDTDMRLAPDKCFWYAAAQTRTDSGNFFLGGARIPRKYTFDCVGASISTKMGARTLAGRRERNIGDGCALARRVARLGGLQFEARDFVLGASPGQKLFYACEVSDINGQGYERISLAMAHGLWSTAPRSRQRHVLFHVLAHGHRLDPRAAIPYRRVSALVTQMSKDGTTQVDEYRAGLRSQICALVARYSEHPADLAKRAGPLAMVISELASVEWSLQGTTLTGKSADGGPSAWQLTGPQSRVAAGELKHDLREALRSHILGQVVTAGLAKQPSRRRPRDKFSGMEAGVDGSATRHLIQSGQLTTYQQAVLRGIIAGGVDTQESLHRRSQVQTPHCVHCAAEGTLNSGDLRHLWWDCPEYAHIRELEHNAEVSAADRSNWPPCLLNMGIMTRGLMPSSFDRRDLAAKVQRLMLDIQLDRINATQLAPDAPWTRQLLSDGDYPWDWQPDAAEQCALAPMPETLPNSDGGLLRAVREYFRRLEWAHEQERYAVSFLELAIDFEVSSGYSFPRITRPAVGGPAPQTAAEPPDASRAGPLPPGIPKPRYRGFFDGGARGNGTEVQGPAGAGAVFFDGDDVLFAEHLPLGRETNAVAENMAAVLLLQGINRVEHTLAHGEEIGIYGDNTTSVRNLNEEVVVSARSENRDSARAARREIQKLRESRVVHPRHVPRRFNGYADWESNVAMDLAAADIAVRAAGSKTVISLMMSLMRKATNTLKDVNGGQDVFLGIATPVNTLTALGNPTAMSSGISRRPKFLSKEETQRVLRELRDSAQRVHAGHAGGTRRPWSFGFEPAHFYPLDRDERKRQWLMPGRGEPAAPR